MKDYKRLTSEQGFNCRKCVNGKCQTPDMFCPYRCECERYNRLYNLEDKIERGEIDYVADKDKEIARLTEENESLKEQVKELDIVEKSTYRVLFRLMKITFLKHGIDDNEVHERIKELLRESEREILREMQEDNND